MKSKSFLGPWTRACLPALLGAAWLAGMGAAQAQDRVIKLAGMGTQSGVLKQFGANSEAAMRGAIEQINQAGGVRLADGARARLAVEYFDDRCAPDEGVRLVRRFAASDALAVVGTTCSPVVEAVFGVLQKKAGDDSDSGLQVPVFADVAMKIGLARMSEWAFRNIPDEPAMYESLFAWLKARHPEARTVYGGVEENFVHSRQTWYSVMKQKAQGAGYEVKGESRWLLDDTQFATQVREMKEANADVVVVSAHPFTACGVLKEMQRQGVRPRVLVGLTSISSPETLEVCGRQAEGLLIPTSYAPVNPRAKAAAQSTAKHGGYADLHSMASWENVHTIKQAIEAASLHGKPETVQADRAKLRAALAAMKQTEGLLGTLQRMPDREALKPYVFVQAKAGDWQIVARDEAR